MTDVWSTESMGVAIKPCNCEADKLSSFERKEAKTIEKSCQKIGTQWLIPYPWKRDPSTLPNNRLQAEKKQEATECRLAKNPEHAKAYDEQMTELTEMNFARKLTKEQMTAYKDPIHYISHHEVVIKTGKEDHTNPHRLQFVCVLSRPSLE